MRALKNALANGYEEGNGYTEKRVGSTSMNKKGRARANRGNQQYQWQENAIGIVND